MLVKLEVAKRTHFAEDSENEDTVACQAVNYSVIGSRNYKVEVRYGEELAFKVRINLL